MGKLNQFRIEIDGNAQVYYPGQTVSGRVIVDVKEELKLREIKGYFKGYADVKWTETRSTGKSTYTVTYKGHETYFDHKIVLLGKEHGQRDDIMLKPGSYSYPLSFTLPLGIPSSYEAHIGRVRYCIKAEIDRPWAFNDKTKAFFTVSSLFDLNTKPELMNSATAKDQKVLCCWCCASDPIIAKISIKRQGYVPGEVIVVNAEIDNRSSREMTCSKLSLVMQVHYHAHSYGGKTRTVKNVLFEKKQGKIAGGGTDVWRDEKMPIPPVPPSYLLGCKIIDIRYLLMVTVDPSGIGFDLDVPVEVVIGSIPLASIAQEYGLNIPTTVEPPAPGAPAGLYGDASLPNIPPPTYAESAMGRVFTKEDDDDEHTTGNSNYAPVYTYYNWNQQDPTGHFTVQMNEQ